jgi:hypothetical protein
LAEQVKVAGKGLLLAQTLPVRANCTSVGLAELQARVAGNTLAVEAEEEVELQTLVEAERREPLGWALPSGTHRRHRSLS